MKHIICLSIFLALISYESRSQVVFESGYFIDNNGVRTECLIENKEWLNNPSRFNYRYANSGAVLKGEINNIKEFGIGSEQKYIRATVQIDRSSSDLDNLSLSRNPEFQEESIFLKVLVEGDANLYSYTDQNLQRFFFSQNGSEIKQLVYKAFYVSSSKTGENNLYKQQLLTTINCQGVSAAQIKNLKYSTKELKKHFVNHNLCQGEEPILFEKPHQLRSHFTMKGGVNISWVNIERNGSSIANQEIKPGIGYAFNLEFEHIMSFNKNKWSFILEPGYNSVNTQIDPLTNYAGLVYNSVTLPLGLRYSMYLDDRVRLMLTALWNFDFAINSNVKLESGSEYLIKRNSHLSLGLGFKLKKFVFESSFHPGYDILAQYAVTGMIKTDLRFSLGYTLR